MFELLSPEQTGINFSNILSESDSLNILNYVYYYNGGGVGIADFNNDGLEDIFFTGNEISSKLYLNKDNLNFEDVTNKSGLETNKWCTGVAIADVNSDGWKDIYICVAGYTDSLSRKNLLYINQGKKGELKFIEKAEEFGLADRSYSTHAAFFDYDLDGDLDLYVLNHTNERSTLNTPLPKKINGESISNDHLYRNNGNNTFSDITNEAGILTEGYGLGIAINDFNYDGWPDIYVSNDFIYNDLLYINEGGIYFSNKITDYLTLQTYNGMGCDAADFNNDGLVDLIEVDMLPETDFKQKMMAGSMTWDKWRMIEQAGYEPQYMRNTLQLAMCSVQSTVKFSEIGQLAGVHQTDWSWAPLFADIDNDGWKDLFITNGYLRDITDQDFIDYSNNISMFKNQKQADRELLPEIKKLNGKKLPNRIFKNNGDPDGSGQVLVFSPKYEEWGMTKPSFSNGAAYADLDLDGDLDLVINNINEPAYIFENKSNELIGNNYLNIRLVGETKNPQGIDASICISIDGKKQLLQQYLSRGFMSTVSEILHFGLGNNSKIDSLEVTWSDGKKQLLTNISANQLLELSQENAKHNVQKQTYFKKPIFEEVTGDFVIDFKHTESNFNDFQFQPLLPHGFSKNGPPIVTGDLNDDGLDDFYVGGAKGQAGCIFFQKSDGHFSKKELREESEPEDTDAVIFDATDDGLNDLLVTSGSHEFGEKSNHYQSRLYLNKGDGRFQWAKNALPEMNTPASCVSAADFDQDGDIDLFIGGSAIPNNYPLPARSYLLRNEGGVFSDATEEVKGLSKIGIVNAAAWGDVNNDGVPDLVLAGEWMPITIFKNSQGKLMETTAEMGLAETSGWWNALVVNDLDADGDLDLVAGNFGLNSKFRTTPENPLTIYAHDFNHSGSMQGIICRFTEGKEKPIFQRDRLLAQIRGLEKKYPRHAMYADASVQDIFGEKALAGTYQRKCNFLQTSVFINEGNGQRFTIHPLSNEAQVAPINAILCADFNADNNIDILLAGNTHSQNISIGQCDASRGLLLTGDGFGGFEVLNAERNGLFVEGVVKDLATIKTASGQELLIVGVQDGKIKVFIRTPEGISRSTVSDVMLTHIAEPNQCKSNYSK